MTTDHNHACKVDLQWHRKWAHHITTAVTYLVGNPEIVPSADDRDMLMQLCSAIEEHLDRIEEARRYLHDSVETRPAALEAVA